MSHRLFVEILSNIGVVSIHTTGHIVALENNTKIKDNVADTVCVKFDDTITKYKIPTLVIVDANIQNAFKASHCSYIRGKNYINKMMKKSIEDAISARDPFDINKLKSYVNENLSLLVNCKYCRTELFRIDSNYPRLFSLPDEHWKEMMDLWHCHKPDISKDGMTGLDQIFSKKLTPKSDTLLLNEFYILLDTILLNDKIISNKDQQECLCRACNYPLGILDKYSNLNNTLDKPESANTMKLLKSDVNITGLDKCKNLLIEYSVLDYISLHILDFMKNYGSRFFVIKPNMTSDKYVILWCLDYDMRIAINEKEYNNKLKVMYKIVDDAANDKKLSELKANHNIEEVILNSSTHDETSSYNVFIESIETTNQLVTFDNVVSNNKLDWKLSYI